MATRMKRDFQHGRFLILGVNAASLSSWLLHLLQVTLVSKLHSEVCKSFLFRKNKLGSILYSIVAALGSIRHLNEQISDTPLLP